MANKLHYFKLNCLKIALKKSNLINSKTNYKTNNMIYSKINNNKTNSRISNKFYNKMNNQINNKNLNLKQTGRRISILRIQNLYLIKIEKPQKF